MPGCRERLLLLETSAPVTLGKTRRQGVNPYGMIFIRAPLRRRRQALSKVQQYENCERLLGAEQQCRCHAVRSRLLIQQNVSLVEPAARRAARRSVSADQRQLDEACLATRVIDALYRFAVVSGLRQQDVLHEGLRVAVI